MGVRECGVGLGHRAGDMYTAERVGNAVEDRREFGVWSVIGVPAECDGQGADDVQVARVAIEQVATSFEVTALIRGFGHLQGFSADDSS